MVSPLRYLFPERSIFGIRNPPHPLKNNNIENRSNRHGCGLVQAVRQYSLKINDFNTFLVVVVVSPTGLGTFGGRGGRAGGGRVSKEGGASFFWGRFSC